MNRSIKEEEVVMKKIKKEVTVDWVVENIKIEGEPVPELYFKEDPDVKEERKQLFENIQLYYKDEAHVNDEVNIILKLEKVKDSVPENRGDVDNQNSCSISTKSITPEEFNIEENIDSEYAASQNANSNKFTTPADDLTHVTESKNRQDHVHKRSLRVRSVVSYDESQEESSSSKIQRTEVEKQFVCEYCNYSTTGRYILKKHILTHIGEKPFSCDNCSYRTSRKDTLKTHKYKHTGEKPYACDKCSYHTTNNHTLKKHQYIHTEEKRFSCDKCSYSTTWSQGLKTHKYKHTEDKPYACDKCSYRTTNNHMLKLHQYIHREEKLFSCDKCSYSTTWSYSFKIHKCLHTGEKSYACDKCSFCATNSHLLKIHKDAFEKTPKVPRLEKIPTAKNRHS